jgi:Trk-type K+ transport system membrane component
LGLSSGDLKNLRVAFTGTTSQTAGTVQFYDCDLNSAQTVASNCVTAQTGTYAISTVGGMRVMRFAGHAETVMNQTRLYVEVKDAPSVIGGNWVFVAREIKPSVAVNQSMSMRLNATAWAAMKTQLGL